MKTLRRIPRRFWLGLGLIAASNLLVVGLQVYQSRVRADDLEASRAAVTHTFDVISEIVALDRFLQDGERSQRGYLLTGRKEYLQPYQTSLREIPEHLARIKELTLDNPEQQRRWPFLEKQIGVKLDELKRTIEVRDAEGPEAARKIVETDVGLNAMSAISGFIDAALSTENGLLAQRIERNAEEDRSVARIAAITTVVGLVGMLAGITLAVLSARHLLKIHDTLDQTRAQLAQAQKLEALGQLTGGIAHDFNNLLQGITGGISLLQRRLPTLGDEATSWINMIKRNADRAASLTQRLLAFSRRQPLNPKPVDLNKVVGGLTEMLRQSLGEHIAVETVMGGGLWLAEVDVAELETAILNLAINARDAMGEGGKLTLETSNTFLDERYSTRENIRPGQYVMVGVSDTGSGMSAETAQQAFEPFFTTKAIGKGTGLGLSQVYGFVKQSMGHIKIYSELQEGTTVKIYFPRFTPSAGDPLSDELQVPAAEPSGEAILVVEDDADVRLFTATALAEQGFRVTTANDASSALRILEAEPSIHLLLTDVGLPGGTTGRQLADEARRRRPELRVLFMTGYARNAIVHGGRLDPGVDLIVKPFSERALIEKVRNVLARRSSDG